MRCHVKMWNTSGAIVYFNAVISLSKLFGIMFCRRLISLYFKIKHRYCVRRYNAALVFLVEKFMPKVIFTGTIFDVEAKEKVNKSFQNFRM
jgi:hypothetical protein